jgi:hypothetical protein
MYVTLFISFSNIYCFFLVLSSSPFFYHYLCLSVTLLCVVLYFCPYIHVSELLSSF